MIQFVAPVTKNGMVANYIIAGGTPEPSKFIVEGYVPPSPQLNVTSVWVAGCIEYCQTIVKGPANKFLHSDYYYPTLAQFKSALPDVIVRVCGPLHSHQDVAASAHGPQHVQVPGEVAVGRRQAYKPTNEPIFVPVMVAKLPNVQPGTKCIKITRAGRGCRWELGTTIEPKPLQTQEQMQAAGVDYPMWATKSESQSVLTRGVPSNFPADVLIHLWLYGLIEGVDSIVTEANDGQLMVLNAPLTTEQYSAYTESGYTLTRSNPYKLLKSTNGHDIPTWAIMCMSLVCGDASVTFERRNTSITRHSFAGSLGTFKACVDAAETIGKDNNLGQHVVLLQTLTALPGPLQLVDLERGDGKHMLQVNCGGVDVFTAAASAQLTALREMCIRKKLL
jgi:hypothetical protein